MKTKLKIIKTKEKTNKMKSQITQSTHSERNKREEAMKGWDPVFSLLSEETIKSKSFLVRTGKRG